MTVMNNIAKEIVSEVFKDIETFNNHDGNISTLPEDIKESLLKELEDKTVVILKSNRKQLKALFKLEKMI